jgi:hypothetical protein
MANAARLQLFPVKEKLVAVAVLRLDFDISRPYGITSTTPSPKSMMNTRLKTPT